MLFNLTHFDPEDMAERAMRAHMYSSKCRLKRDDQRRQFIEGFATFILCIVLVALGYSGLFG